MHLAELPSESELGEVDISRWLMTRRNVASYDCRSDVSAGLPGIAYVTCKDSPVPEVDIVKDGTNDGTDTANLKVPSLIPVAKPLVKVNEIIASSKQ